jgi:hypothetical protein
MEPTQVVVGDVEAGRSAKIKREVNRLIKGVSEVTFDLADLLYEIKSKNFFAEWGFTSFSQYLKSLIEQGMKYSKSYYLYRIKENCVSAGLKPEEYEPVGVTKLRIISRLKPAGEYNGVPMVMIIRELTLKAATMSAEEIQFEVDTIEGKTEDESLVWMNFKVKKMGRENVIKPALQLIKKHCPESQLVDEDGHVKEMSDGAALEMMAANILADPNFNTEEIVEQPTDVEEPVEDPGTELADSMVAEGAWPPPDDSPIGDGTI